MSKPKKMRNFAKSAATVAAALAWKGLKKKNKSRKMNKSSAQKIVREQKKMKRQVRNLKRATESDMGLLVYRQLEVDALLATIAQQGTLSWAGASTTEIEAALAQLRYYDPAAPSALVTADGTTGSYLKKFLFTKCYAKLSLRNNYQLPCHATVYVCVPRTDTSITPLTAWSNGLSDASNGSVTNITIYPSDSVQFGELWRVEKTQKKLIQPGDEMVCSYGIKPFTYDPSLTDSHNFTFQNGQSFVFLVAIRGIPGHDTSADEQSFSAAGVERVIERTYNIKYAAGADIRYTYVTETQATITNGLVASSKPVSDNIGYSQA